jgi:hypothetical protein
MLVSFSGVSVSAFRSFEISFDFGKLDLETDETCSIGRVCIGLRNLILTKPMTTEASEIRAEPIFWNLLEHLG